MLPTLLLVAAYATNSNTHPLAQPSSHIEKKGQLRIRQMNL
jgi:hypothetical protein